MFHALCLTNIGLVQCFSLRLPSILHPFVFLVLFSLLLLCVLCSTSSGLCSDFSPAPLKFARFIFCFVLFSFNLGFCVLSLTNLIFFRTVRRVLFDTVYSSFISSAPVDFEWLCFPLHFSVIWYACFATRPPVLRVYSLVPVYLLPCVPSCFSILLVYVCYSFLAFSAVISYVFLPALPW